MERAEDAAVHADEHDEKIVDVRQIAREAQRDDWRHAEHLRDEKVGHDRRGHDRHDERSAELLVDLLDGKEDAGERGVESC